MKKLRGACVIGQSGGPTAVINASVAGAVETALKNDIITKVYAARFGIKGIIDDRLFDMGLESAEELSLLKTTPSSALGSCRYKLGDSDSDDTDYRRILETFKKHDIRYFFYNGGNDSMDTCSKVSKYMQKVGYDCRIIGIPKTIDNDLFGTDHCPGYASAAKYIATSVAEISRDNNVYDLTSVVIFEIMGRNAGWLTAAAALADKCGEGPDFIYLPELPFSLDKMIEDIKKTAKVKRSIFVAVSEGIRDESGRFISEYDSDFVNRTDAFGHTQMGGLAVTLAGIVKKRTGFKTRSIELSLLQRCAAHCASKTDIDEAYMAGEVAVLKAVEGCTDVMIGFAREPGEVYKCSAVTLPLTSVANAEKTVPLDWINAEHNNINKKFFDYALPLIAGEPKIIRENGLPRFANLAKHFV